MYKKLAIILSILIIAIFSFSVCFANDMLNNAVNDVRNVVGGAENTVENTAKDTNNKMFTSTNNSYTATRTNTEGSTLMGMNATMWTWLIIGIATIAIVALVWYYSMQMRSSNYDDKD